MNGLKEKIYGEVERMYKGKYGVPRIQSMLTKNLSQEVPLNLIREIIDEIKAKIDHADTNIKKIDKMLDSKSKEKTDGGLKTLVKGTEDERKYGFNYETDHYLFATKGGDTYPILRSTVCAMRRAFSAQAGGENKTQNEVMTEFKLSSEAWIMIKGQTPMYKTSPAKDPVTIELLLKQDKDILANNLEIEVMAAQEAQFNNIVNRADRVVKDRELRKYKEEDELNKRFRERMIESIKLFNPKDFSNIIPSHINNDDVYHAILADLHLGKIGTDGIVTRIGKITRYLLDRPEKYIKIKSLGDIFECVVINSEMHPGQRLGMESMSTTDTIMLAVKLWEEMLFKLYEAGKIVVVDSIPGNHDRFTEREEDDPEKIPSEIVFRFLQELVRKTDIKINIFTGNEPIVFTEGKIIYVIDHGYKFNKEKLQRIILEHSRQGYYLVVITADKHHKEMEINDHTTRIQTQALAGRGQYDKKLVLSSMTGMLGVKENSDGLIDSETKTFR